MLVGARRWALANSFAVGANRLAECLTLRHGSPGATRPADGAFLDEVTALGLDLGTAAELARESGRRWEAIADQAAAWASEGGASDPAAAITQLTPLVAEVHDLEVRLAAALAEPR